MTPDPDLQRLRMPRLRQPHDARPGTFVRGRLAARIPGALRPSDLDTVLARIEHLETTP